MQWPSEKEQNELFGIMNFLMAKHMIFVGLFHSNAGKNVIYNFS
jgi:uncharacterized alpha-E superfamily protein